MAVQTTVLDNPDPAIRSSTGETRPVLWHSQGQPDAGLPRSCNSTPQRLLSGPFPALDFAPRRTPKEGRQALIRCLNRLSGVVVSEPIWDDRRGPKTHSRRTDRKLGQLRLARQGLVRVPESNTKYGGQRGITGGDAAPVMEASIGESSEIPNVKICLAGSKFRLLPLFTGQLFIRRKGLPWRDSRKPTEGEG